MSSRGTWIRNGAEGNVGVLKKRILKEFFYSDTVQCTVANRNDAMHRFCELAAFNALLPELFNEGREQPSA
jgi:hypothetical protein